ncbi:MAG: copper amine oxidase N-terminal domain-containing protein [Proteocatella sp.]
MKKRILSTFIIVGMIMGMFGMPIPVASAEEGDRSTMMFENVDYAKSSNIRVIIDGKQVMFDVSPQAINGRIMVPMSTIFRELGLTVSWDSATKTAEGTNSDISIVFTINSNKALVNGQEQILDVPARAINNKTMIPLRFLSENMGYNIVWIQSSNLILMSKSTIIEWRYDGYEKVAPYKEYEYKYFNGTRTEEMRYNGKNHDVKFYTLYSSNGKLIPNVPEFDMARYGSGWYLKSPFVGKTYWIDLDTIGAIDGNSRFYDFFL